MKENYKKIKKYHYEFISNQNRLEIDEKDINKNYRPIPFRSYLMCNRKSQNKIAKKLKKIKKNTISASFQAKIGWKRLRKREKRHYCSVSFLPDV